jgi:acyl carrier protein
VSLDDVGMGMVSARELASLIVESLNLEGVAADQIDPTAPLFGDGLGLDSLDMLEISLVIQQRYGVRLKADDPQNEQIFSSLQSLAAHVGAVQAQRS